VLETSPALARREAKDLALWYIELVLVALARYQGQYVNRLHRGLSVGAAMEVVPWAPKKSLRGTP
jgi:hypothetical protein